MEPEPMDESSPDTTPGGQEGSGSDSDDSAPFVMIQPESMHLGSQYSQLEHQNQNGGFAEAMSISAQAVGNEMLGVVTNFPIRVDAIRPASPRTSDSASSLLLSSSPRSRNDGDTDTLRGLSDAAEGRRDRPPRHVAQIQFQNIPRGSGSIEMPRRSYSHAHERRRPMAMAMNEESDSTSDRDQGRRGRPRERQPRPSRRRRHGRSNDGREIRQQVQGGRDDDAEDYKDSSSSTGSRSPSPSISSEHEDNLGADAGIVHPPIVRPYVPGRMAYKSRATLHPWSFFQKKQ